jgi:site-specific recombinase XerD
MGNSTRTSKISAQSPSRKVSESALPSTPLLHVTSLDNPEELAGVAREWYNLDVANGYFQEDTAKIYLHHFEKWLEWCAGHGVHPGRATENEVLEYRRWLVDTGSSTQTINLKLVAMRRFYHAANRLGLISFNPVIDVKASSHGRPAKERAKCMAKKDARELLASLPNDESLKGKRDQAMFALMMLDGLSRISVIRASVQDLEHGAGHCAELLIHGKDKDYQVKLSHEATKLLSAYLKDRGPVAADEYGEPLIATVNKWGSTGQKRIGRSAISKEMDALLKVVEKKGSAGPVSG